MRQDHLVAGADKAGRVVEDYRSFKEGYHDTKLRSEEQGFAFKPLVFEAHGGSWCGMVAALITMVGRRQIEGWGGGTQESRELRLSQRLSILIHQENALAVLRRLAGRGDGMREDTGLGWGDCGGDWGGDGGGGC